MSFIFIVALRARKRLTPKDVATVKGLTSTDVYIRQIWLFPQRIQNMPFIIYRGVKNMEKVDA
jgi:hypothetical protein